MTNKKLKLLYDSIVQIKDRAYFDEVTLNEPDEFDDNEHICFEEKIIYCIDDVFYISCLYDQHPTIKFNTIQEVLEFFRGTWESMYLSKGFDKLTSLDIAFNVGLYCEHLATMKYIKDLCLSKCLSETQYKFNVTNNE